MPAPKKKIIPAKDAERAVVYPELSVQMCVGENAIDVERAKTLLGWRENEKKTEQSVPEVSSLFNTFVEMGNNTKNRYVTPGWIVTLSQEHLNKRWRFNGETIVIGKTGQVLSGQHRLISLILAWFEWAKGDNSKHWKTIWTDKQGPILETIIVYGVDESDDIFKTLNSGKKGTLAENLYRSELLSKEKPADRKPIAKRLEHATKFLWLRTGVKNDPFVNRETLSELMDFLTRHKRLIRAVKHIFIEDRGAEGKDERNIAEYMSPGYASALMYLMACSMEDGDKYRSNRPPSEASIDFDRVIYSNVVKDDNGEEEARLDTTVWDKAAEFWQLLASVSPDFKGYREAEKMAFTDPATGIKAGSRLLKASLLIKTWNAFLRCAYEVKDLNSNVRTTKERELRLKYMSADALDLGKHIQVDEAGYSKLVDPPTCGGIDIGESDEVEDVRPTGEDEPDEAELAAIEQRKEAEKKKALERKANGRGKKEVEPDPIEDESHDPNEELTGPDEEPEFDEPEEPVAPPPPKKKAGK